MNTAGIIVAEAKRKRDDAEALVVFYNKVIAEFGGTATPKKRHRRTKAQMEAAKPAPEVKTAVASPARKSKGAPLAIAAGE